ncbi:galactonate dehydratase [Paenibacillus cremeus]|uniref:Galactonate dehydratase n=1 Tax=Paenibacillus cremeus TaxID=2163881 RepID=A0A559JDE9_9BACL|nr:galactonate dehydratase [Paenibacillus cremeus]TVX97896.1 galactonate dehydratase [Paenibacillus cremeus]
MKIIDVQTILADQYMFVKVITDEGITGLGESGTWAFLEASAGAVEHFKRYLIGQDPLRIEHHWNYMYRSFHFRGAAIMGALSAIDIALWDIAGKYYNAPVYQLLGGKTRDKARAYFHVYGKTTEEMLQGIREAKSLGFTAIGHLSPLLDLPRGTVTPFETHAQMINNAIDRVRQYREAVGDEVDLCIEIHRRLSPADAVVLANGIEPYRPYFYEDPTKPDNFDSMAYIAEHINIPLATGERLHTPQEFAMLLKRNAVQYVRPDVCIVGGITGAKKIAAMAEAFDVQVVPHNPLSPVSTAACLQVAACIPNFAIQEYPIGEDQAPKNEIVKSTVTLDKGFLIIPDTPGIGIELAEDAAEKYPFRARAFKTRLHEDGSVMDH